MDPEYHENGQRAPQACVPCRKQKRKCDKQLPGCSLCQRIGRTCDYSDDQRSTAPSQEDFSALRQEVAELKNLLVSGTISAPALNSSTRSTSSSNGQTNRSASPLTTDLAPSLTTTISTPASSTSSWTPPTSSFPPLFFLDSTLFDYQHYQIQAPHVRVPQGALAALGSSADMRAMIEHYFNTVHTYFPIISKIRLYQHLANPAHEPGADTALLFLAMKLACSELQHGEPAQSPLYQEIKTLYVYVEAQTGFTIQMMQALLLISLYEIGHAIYPAAYLSTGTAARLGHAMGIHAKDAPQMLPRCVTWTEQEERRRVWWGVLLVDRFVNIGHRKKPFATNDPSLEAHLPTDDLHWDRGEMVVTAPLSLSANETTRAAPFARTCQATHLLGKVLRHLNDPNLPLEYRFEDAQQLNRTIRSLAAVIASEADAANDQDDHILYLKLSTSLATCYTALLELYDNYCCPEHIISNAPESQLVVQKDSIAGLADITQAVMQLARQIRRLIDPDQHSEASANFSRLSPFLVVCLYGAAANYAWYVRESSEREPGARLREVKDLVTLVNERWRSADEYLRIVEATEFQLMRATG